MTGKPVVQTIKLELKFQRKENSMFSTLKTLLIEDYRAFMRPRDSWTPVQSRRSLFLRRWNILVRDWLCQNLNSSTGLKIQSRRKLVTSSTATPISLGISGSLQQLSCSSKWAFKAHLNTLKVFTLTVSPSKLMVEIAMIGLHFGCRGRKNSLRSSGSFYNNYVVA